MTRPADIPADVWEAAYAVLVQLMRGALSSVEGKSAMQDIETIALALLAERQRCVDELPAIEAQWRGVGHNDVDEILFDVKAAIRGA